MSWGTDFTSNIFISHKILTSKYDLENYIEEIEDDIKFYETRLQMLAIATPKDIVNADDNAISNIQIEVNDALEVLRECYVNLYKADLYEQYFNKTNVE